MRCDLKWVGHILSLFWGQNSANGRHWHWHVPFMLIAMVPNVWYLGLGMRYEAGICTVVISMNGAFK